MDKHVQCLTFHTYKMCRIEESLATPLQDLDFRTWTFPILNSRGNVHCSDHVTATRPGAARATPAAAAESDAAGRPGGTTVTATRRNPGQCQSRTGPAAAAAAAATAGCSHAAAPVPTPPDRRRAGDAASVVASARRRAVRAVPCRAHWP
jgi:hypothetical protein